MDTDTLLAEIRRFTQQWQDVRQPLSTGAYDRAIEHIVDLDRKLSRGDRPPTAWAGPHHR
jgi:hypothetical protein